MLNKCSLGFPQFSCNLHKLNAIFKTLINPVMAYALLIYGMLPPVPPFQTFHMPTNA